MSTNFDDSFVAGDLIEVDQIKQFISPIHDLESGKAFFREASGSGGQYVVAFNDPAHNGLSSLCASCRPDYQLQGQQRRRRREHETVRDGSERKPGPVRDY